MTEKAAIRKGGWKYSSKGQSHHEGRTRGTIIVARSVTGALLIHLAAMVAVCDAFVVGPGMKFSPWKMGRLPPSGRRAWPASQPSTGGAMLGAALDNRRPSWGLKGVGASGPLMMMAAKAIIGGELGAAAQGGWLGGVFLSRCFKEACLERHRRAHPQVALASSKGIGEEKNKGVEQEEDDDDDLSVPPKYEGTIYAQSTAQGMGGIAVVRVSGVDALPSLASLSRPTAKPPKPRYAGVRTLLDPATGALLDKALVLFFPGPNSFTGEDIVEYHLHGGVAIVNSVLAALGKAPGLRMAGPGEFTRRAYLNGRIDLLEAEALNDLIHAETSGQQRQAMLQMEGAHRQLYQSWRTGILQCLAHVNAYIDYGEDAALQEEETLTPVRRNAEAIEKQIERHLADGKRGETLRSGLRCALVGPPNAGKSSLLNMLAARPAAIVSAIPGTTRDIVSVRLEIRGVAVSVDDTAGLRGEGADEVEEEGMRRSAAAFRKAQLRVIVLDGGALTPETVTGLVGLLRTLAPVEAIEEDIMMGKKKVGNWGWHRKDKGFEVLQGSSAHDTRGDSDVPILVVLNKCDLVEGDAESLEELAVGVEQVVSEALGANEVHAQWISCETGEGTEDLIEELGKSVKELVAVNDDSPAITRARHRELLERCSAALRRFRTSKFPVDVQAEELGLAMEAVGEIYGDADMEEMLDVVFRDFCIGK